MRYIADRLCSSSNKVSIEERIPKLCEAIAILEKHYGIRPFNHQSVGSLLEMNLLTFAVEPAMIIEIGAGSRSSTLALASGYDCPIISVDINPVDFTALSRELFPMGKFHDVISRQMNITDFEIDLNERPILMLYDAHDDDIPGSIISKHAIENWFPKMAGSVVMVHDISLQDKRPRDDVLLAYGGKKIYSAQQHYSGKWAVGYGEVDYLIPWMNEHKIPLEKPEDELYELGFSGLPSSLVYFTVPEIK